MIMLLLAVTGGKAEGNLPFRSDSFRTSDGKELTITFIKHGSLLLNYSGKYIYTDPVSLYADYGSLPKADVILITHEHWDHLDPKAIAKLKKPETRLIVNAASQDKLKEGEILKNGDKITLLPGVMLEAVAAYNTTPGREIYHPKGRDNGYVLSFGKIRVYVAGDTEDIPEMEELKAIDIAFLPVNQPYTMTVEQAARAVRMFKPRILYPYHYGETDVAVLKQMLEDEPGTEVRIRELQ